MPIKLKIKICEEHSNINNFFLLNIGIVKATTDWTSKLCLNYWKISENTYIVQCISYLFIRRNILVPHYAFTLFDIGFKF